ncbi:MAG: enoyl-CoA hydratase/isomerase family protein [Actinomycetota bacterium]
MTDWTSETEDLNVKTVRECAVITFDRPEKLNAMTQEMRRDVAAAIRHYGDGTHARGIVLTGAGRAFSAGEDLKATPAGASGDVLEAVESFHDITRAVLETSVPVIAAVNGLAVGGASEVTMCCDARVGTSNSEYFMPENHIGLTISNASSILLRRLVGNAATRIVLEAKRMNASEALDLGLLDEIVDAERLVDHCIDLIHRWNRPGSATAMHLALLRPTPEEIHAAIQRENVAAKEAFDAGVVSEGIDRFWRNKLVATAD